MCDCPYESSSLYIKDLGTEHRLKSGEVLKESGHCAIQCNNNIASFKMAEYSTKEKALKVIGNMREAWMEKKSYFRFPPDNHKDEQLKGQMNIEDMIK